VTRQWRGIFTIPCTPFTDSGALDLDSLRREVDFCIAAGAHGLVAPVNASEFWTLSDNERRTVAETIVTVANGRLPVVIGVAGGSAPVAVEFAQHAQESGGDAVIAMPPYVRVASPNAIYDYFRALSRAVTIPIFIQNHDAPAGTRMAHCLRAGDQGLTYLAFGTREPNDVCYYPRSNKIFWRGLGLIARLEPLDYFDGEPS